MGKTKRQIDEDVEIVALDKNMIDENESSDPFKVLVYKELKEKMNKLLSELDAKEEYVIRQRFGLNSDNCAKTYEEIGECLSLPKEMVIRIKQKALNKLRHPLRYRILRRVIGDY